MHSPNTTTTFQALFRVFVLPALSKPLARIPITFQSRLPRLSFRSFSHTTPNHSKTRAPEQRHQKWDDEINHKVIYVVDPATNKLSEPRTRFDILRSIDSKTHRLVQLSPDEPSNPDFIPVCRIVSKKEAYEAEKRRKTAQKEARKASVRSSDVGMKTLEINWAIDGNDLGHRLERVVEFLKEGRRVEVVLAARKGGRKATRDECEGVLRRIREAVGKVDGAKERRDMDGKMGGFATLMFQGSAVGKARAANDAEDSVEEND